jgi:uncharacterized membrane protein YciS (DUF1049 family)
MTDKTDADALLRDALRAEGVEGFADIGEPSMPDMVIEVFRGRLRLYAIMFFLMILACAGVAVLCAAKAMAAPEVMEALRWGLGFIAALIVTLSGKTWYWLQMDRVAVSRELKRLELQVAHLATALRETR